MRTTIILVCLFLTAVVTVSQEKTSYFGYGISSDFLSIPLNEQSLGTNSTNVYCTYSVYDNLNFRIGFDGVLLKDLNAKRFQNLSGLFVGAGYIVLQDQTRDFTTELTASASNGLINFSSFKDYHADLGVRFMMFKSFYLGTGMRLSHNETASFLTAPLNSYNWYMQMGIQFYLGKR